MSEHVRTGDIAHPRLPRLRRRVILGLATAVGAAVAAAVILTGHSSTPSRSGDGGRFQVGPSPTLAQPLGPSASQISLAAAPSVLGGSITLPNYSGASRGNVGTVWAAHYGGDDTVVAVTFPQTGLIVEYTRPVQTPSAIYHTLAEDHQNMFSLVDLNGVPALATLQNSDQGGTNFGSVEFVAGGTQIAVLGHYDQATLKSVAQSIVDQTGA